MITCPSFENHDGKSESYSGIVQSKEDTCVFASIAGAVNYVTTQQHCTEASLVNAFQADKEKIATFGSVAKYVPDSLVETQEFHDRDCPLSDFSQILHRLQRGAVVILSLEYADVSNGNATRTGKWHMLSIFRNRSGDLQVWDTGNRSGFFGDNEFRQLICADSLAVEYNGTHLVLKPA